MNFWYDMILNTAATIIIAVVRDPAQVARLKPLLFKISAVIYAAASQMGAAPELDQKIDAEIAKLPSPPQP